VAVCEASFMVIKNKFTLPAATEQASWQRMLVMLIADGKVSSHHQNLHVYKKMLIMNGKSV
jgi:hypothetical protein